MSKLISKRSKLISVMQKLISKNPKLISAGFHLRGLDWILHKKSLQSSMTTIDKCTYGNWIAGKEISAELKILQVLIVEV